MQFRTFIKEKKLEKEYDCASCEKISRLCLLKDATINAKYMKVDVKDVTIENHTKVFDAWQEEYGEAPQWFILRELSICPIPLISPLSHALYRYYNLLGGLGSNTYKDLDNIPALYAEAVNIIADEEAKKIDG